MATTAAEADGEPVATPRTHSSVAAPVMTAPIDAANRLGGPAVGRGAAAIRGRTRRGPACATGLASGPSAARSVKSAASTA